MKNTELLQEQTSAGSQGNSTSSNEEIVKKEAIGESPFVLVTEKNGEEEKHFLALGQYMVSDRTTDKERLTAFVNTINWELLIPVIAAIVDIEVKERTTKN